MINSVSCTSTADLVVINTELSRCSDDLAIWSMGARKVIDTLNFGGDAGSMVVIVALNCIFSIIVVGLITPVTFVD